MSPKQLVGRALAYPLFATGLHRLFFRRNAVIVAFHRIADSPLGHHLNCGVDLFDQLCLFFKKQFEVVSLAELLATMSAGQSIGRRLVITFDDGYKDNHAVAAPILRKHGLPATFFVATNFIDSKTIPFWDAKYKFPSEWMTWDDVSELAEWGFDIGAHTESHIDLGSADNLEQAAIEIAGSRRILEQRLGIPVHHFAYPFGGKENIRAEAVQLVADAGLKCCLSCHGGIVAPGDSAFKLRREPINDAIVAQSPWSAGLGFVRETLSSRDSDSGVYVTLPP